MMNKPKIAVLLLCFLYTSVNAATDIALKFGAIPQQSPRKLAKIWNPLIDYISQVSGMKIYFAGARDFKSFEEFCEHEYYDIVYMSPYHFTTYNDIGSYTALVKAKNKHIRGIVVVRKDSGITSISQLEKSNIIFPSSTAFAASVLPRRYLNDAYIQYKPFYSNNHDNAYIGVSRKVFAAAGGVIRTYNNASSEYTKNLRVLWTSKPYTPHAIAVRSSLPENIVEKLQAAFLALTNDKNAVHLYQNMHIKHGFEIAQDSDWDDVRALNIVVGDY